MMLFETSTLPGPIVDGRIGISDLCVVSFLVKQASRIPFRGTVLVVFIKKMHLSFLVPPLNFL